MVSTSQEWDAVEQSGAEMQGRRGGDEGGEHECGAQEAGVRVAPHAEGEPVVHVAAAEAEVGDEDHQPGEHGPEHRDRKHQQERTVVIAHVENGGESDAARSRRAARRWALRCA